MILQNKNAVIYGAGGSLGGAVAKCFAKEGATVFLSGRHLSSVKKVADEIIENSGKAEAAEVDALDEQAVNRYLTELSNRKRIDISFNAIGWQDVQNIPLAEMSLEDFIRPISIGMETQFITCTAAARVMMQQKVGVILSLTATPGGIGYANVGGFGPACCAVESFSRDLAAELGQYNIRVVNMRSGGSPDSRPFLEALAHDREKTQEFFKKMEDDTMLKRMPMMADVGNLAVFLVSDMARAITGVTVDITSGTTTALNYRVTPMSFVHKELVQNT